MIRWPERTAGRLRRHLGARDQDRLTVLPVRSRAERTTPSSASRCVVEGQHVLADVEAEDLELGRHPFRQVELAELAGGDEVRHPVGQLGIDGPGAGRSANRSRVTGPVRAGGDCLASTPTRASRSRRVGRGGG